MCDVAGKGFQGPQQRFAEGILDQDGRGQGPQLDGAECPASFRAYGVITGSAYRKIPFLEFIREYEEFLQRMAIHVRRRSLPPSTPPAHEDWIDREACV